VETEETLSRSEHHAGTLDAIHPLSTPPGLGLKGAVVADDSVGEALGSGMSVDPVKIEHPEMVSMASSKTPYVTGDSRFTRRARRQRTPLR
jgi:hypothetical protein